MCGQRIADLRLESGEFGLVSGLTSGRVHVDGGGAATGHDAIKGVVIALTDGIKLVIVTAGAGDSDSQEGLGDDINLVFGGAREFLQRVSRREALQHKTIVRRANRRFIEAELFVEARPGQKIAGNMFTEELIVRYIDIQRADKVIAVLVGVGDARVALTAQ